jgi:sortase A
MKRGSRHWRPRWHRYAQALPMLALALTAAAALTAGYWIPAKAVLAQYLLERAWDQTRAGNRGARPWPWADTTPVARLNVPSLGASWVVLSGASGRNLAFAPSHLDGSALPGEPGVSVIAGHRDTHFEVLESLERGARFELERADGTRHGYVVTGMEIVNADVSQLRLDGPDSVLALVTCYPFDATRAGGPLRYVVTAQRSSNGGG